MRLDRTALLVVLVLVLAATTAVAQGTGGLSVQVVDAAGESLPGATVTISHKTGKVKTTSFLTDKDGWAHFPVLQPGSGYSVEAAFPGFGTRRESEIRVPISNVERMVIQLSEEHTERVKVVATPDVVELEKTASTTRFSEEFVQDLPVPGRFYQNVLTLAPGVNDPDGDGNPTVHGSRSRDFQALVGGVSNVDPLTGQFMSLINMDSIEEIEVITGGASVEFGRAQGGFANIIQKQGTNEFEGTFTFLFRSSVLDGDGAADTSNLPDPEFDSFQPAVQFSGPIIKDKLWFRLSHDLTDNETPVNVATGIEVRTDKQWIHSDAVTWQVSPRNKIQFQFQSDPLEVVNAGISSAVPVESGLAFERNSDTYSIKWTAPYSPKILVDTTASWQDLSSDVNPSTTGETNDCTEGALAGALCFNLDTVQFSGSSNRIEQTHSQRLTLKSTATVYAGQVWGANHTFRLGFSVENERFERDLTLGPQLTFFSLNQNDDNQENQRMKTCSDSTEINCSRDDQCPAGETCGGGQDPQQVEIILGSFAVPPQDFVTAKGTNWALFFEDTIRPLSNLVITVGGRVDREEIRSDGRSGLDPEGEAGQYFNQFYDCWLDDAGAPILNAGCEDFVGDWLNSTFSFEASPFELISSVAEQINLPPIELWGQVTPATVTQDSTWTKNRTLNSINIANTNFSPFLSISWDPWNNNKTQLAFTARRYYDKIFLSVPLQELNPVGIDLDVVCPLDRETKERSCQPANSLQPASTVLTVDRKLRTPYQDEYRFVFSRELWTETLLRVEYVRRKYRDQFQDIDLNHIPGDFGRCLIGQEADATQSVAEVLPNMDPTGVFDVNTFPGDGRFEPAFGNTWDDCVGKQQEIRVAGDDGGTTVGGGDSETATDDFREEPDGVADLYTANPAYGRVFEIGNVNQADYEGVVIQVQRRQYRGWEMQGSYTWSMATGNGEDFAQLLGDDQTLQSNEFGFQSNDQRHQVKLSATTITPWGFRLGGSASWASGLPYSCQLQAISTQPGIPSYGSIGINTRERRTVYCNDRRNDIRNDSFWNFDMKLTKEMNLGRGMNLQVTAEIFNLLNDGTYLVYEADFESGRQVNGRDFASPRFGRSFQIGAKLAF